MKKVIYLFSFLSAFLFLSCSKKSEQTQPMIVEEFIDNKVESKKEVPVKSIEENNVDKSIVAKPPSIMVEGSVIAPSKSREEEDRKKREAIFKKSKEPSMDQERDSRILAFESAEKEKLEAAKKDSLHLSLDKELDSLSKGTIAFNTPQNIKYKSTSSIHLVLSPREKDKGIAELVESKGDVITEAVQFSKFVEARLEGKNFEIEAVTAARQPVSLKDTTQWRWQITPLKAGNESLYLNIYAVVKIDGEKHERLLKTFTREMLIDISFMEHPVEFIKHSPSFAYISLASGLCLFFLGFSFIKTRRRRSAMGETVSIASKNVNADIFISYSSKDRELSTKLADLLRGEGLSVWMDVGGIAPASMWSTEIVNALKSAKLVVLVGSVNSFQSHNVVKEVSIASEQQTPIIPLIIDDSEIPDKLAYQLAGVQVVRSSESEIESSAKLISEIISKER